VEENMNAIPQIVRRLLPLREELARAGDDEDKVRGICRIFAQAGETYHTLILRHQEDFFPIVQTLIECAAYHDLDIVSITFRFWYLLGSALGKRKEDPSLMPFLQVYARLLDIIVGHLRFPDDEATQTAAEKDEFRSFRHFMGDTLKDCCYVLGSKDCLSRSLQMIRDILAASQSSGSEPRWQDVEAPLFSMRAMGTEVSPTGENDVIGSIIDIIPELPAHPRMRYAGLLVISRYTEWIDHHPDRIPGLLSYISAGLESEGDVAAAAGQAMSYLCQDCRRHLVPYLPQLYAFLGSVGDRLEPDDLITMGEGVGHIVSTLSPQDALPAMMQFSQPALELIASVSADASSSRLDLKRANIRIDMLERFLETIGPRFREALPAECATKTVGDAYAVIDGLLAKHGSAFWIHQSSVNLFRRSMTFFGPHARGILPALLDRMSSLFQATGFSGYLWIMGRVVEAYGSTADDALKASFQSNYEKVSSKVMQVLENSMPREIPDIIEDYVEVSACILAELPSLLILSPIFPHAFRAAVTALTLVQPSIIHRALDFIRAIVGHDALAVPPSGSQPGAPLSLGVNGGSNGYTDPSSPAYAAAIRSVLSSQGDNLLALLLEGLVTTFPPEQIQLVSTIFRVLVSGFPRECLAWIAPAVEALPNGAVGHADKVKFLERFGQSVERGDLPGVKAALTEGLYRTSRKSRERSRMGDGAGGPMGGDPDAVGGYVDR
jgi:transportin-3